MSSLNTPNQILLRGKVLSNHIFETLENFFQTNEYNEIALDWVGKEKGQPRDSNLQLQCCLTHKWPESFPCLPWKKFLHPVGDFEIAKNQTQSFYPESGWMTTHTEFPLLHEVYCSSEGIGWEDMRCLKLEWDMWLCWSQGHWLISEIQLTLLASRSIAFISIWRD